MKNKLRGEIVDLQMLDMKAKTSMFELMNKYYDNVKRESFEKDLNEKDSIIILRDFDSQDIKGFSTLEVLEGVISDQRIRVLFSGDTIIEKDYWGSLELPKMWLKYAFRRKEEKPETPFYWFLMSKGYKTYKFLPVFFKDFYPKVDGSQDSNFKAILDVFASSKFPKNYQSDKGLILFNGAKDKLKKGVAEIDEKRIRDPHIAYCVQRNPYWKRGDELACITCIDRANLKKRTKMLLESRRKNKGDIEQ